MAGALTLEAEVLEVEHKVGPFNDVAYDFHLAHCLVGRKVIPVRFANDNGDARPPKTGDTIRLEVELPNNTRVTARRYVAPAQVHKVS